MECMEDEKEVVLKYFQLLARVARLYAFDRQRVETEVFADAFQLFRRSVLDLDPERLLLVVVVVRVVTLDQFLERQVDDTTMRNRFTRRTVERMVSIVIVHTDDTNVEG